MLSFTPSSKLEKEMRRLQGLFAETLKSLEDLYYDESTYLRRFALISNIGASTRIENAILTDEEIEWVDTTLSRDGRVTAFEEKRAYIFNKLSKDRERSIEEVVGCRHVLNTIYLQSNELFPLTESIIRALHLDLLRYYPSANYHSGKYKTNPNRVISFNHETKKERIVLDPAPPGLFTGTAMSDLMKWYNNTVHEYPWSLLVSTEFVFRFLAIYPFQDGNGRLGRALFILSLLQSDDRYLAGIASYIAVDRHIEQNRSLYYSTLHQCSGGKFHSDPLKYNIEPLAWFFISIIESSLTDIALYRQRYINLKKLSESALKVLACFKESPQKRLQVSEIVSETRLPRRTVQYSLRTLKGSNFIQILGSGPGTRYQLIF